MNNKKTVLALIALVAVAVLLLGVYFVTRPATQAGVKKFTITVVHADGTSKDFSFKSNKEYVGEVALEEGLISGEQGQYGMYIMEVDGERAVYETDNAYWSFYEGEDYAQQGIDLTPIVDGATYKLVYTPA